MIKINYQVTITQCEFFNYNSMFIARVDVLKHLTAIYHSQWLFWCGHLIAIKVWFMRSWYILIHFCN